MEKQNIRKKMNGVIILKRKITISKSKQFNILGLTTEWRDRGKNQ